MWVQEAIYGHRFVEEQLPYMLVLEVLSICRSIMFDEHLVPKMDHKLLGHNEFLNDYLEQVSISLPRQEELRTILLRNIRIDEIHADKSMDDDLKLKIWVGELGDKYEYLLDRLPSRSFNEIYRAVSMLRGLEIDKQNNRRWTSCFPVPRGPSLMFADLDNKWVSDRRFFGRGGEIVYLMLNRSTEHRDDLRKLLQEDFLGDDDDFNCLAKKLSPPKENHATGSAQIGYLPLKTHKAYDRLAKDWCSILSLEGPSVPQKFEALSCITALNLIRYFAERSSETEQGTCDNLSRNPEFIPLDFLYGKRADLRKVSREYLNRHQEAVWIATDVHIERELSKDNRWSVDNLTPEAVRLILGEVFYMQQKFKDNISGTNKPEILENFKFQACNRARNSIATLILPLARHAGLVAVKKGVGAWFCPRDLLLEAIVFAKVSRTTLLSRFVEDLYDQYGFVIGPGEARRAFSVLPCDVLRFEENLQEFENRLTRLGYVKRLSDDCAFISNPFHSQES